MSQTMTEAAPLTNPFAGPAADWLESVRKRMGVERQRESRYENKILNLRPDMLNGVKAASDEYDATLDKLAQVRRRVELLQAEERDALAAVETENKTIAAAAKELEWKAINALGDKLRATAARVEASLSDAGDAMREAREIMGQMWREAPDKMWTTPGMMAGAIEQGVNVMLAKHLGGRLRSLTLMNEAQILKASLAAMTDEAVRAYLHREPKVSA